MTDQVLKVLSLLAVDALAEARDFPETEDGEELDLENVEIESITVIAGGDWQKPHRVTVNVAESRVTHVELA